VNLHCCKSGLQCCRMDLHSSKSTLQRCREDLRWSKSTLRSCKLNLFWSKSTLQRCKLTLQRSGLELSSIQTGPFRPGPSAAAPPPARPQSCPRNGPRACAASEPPGGSGGCRPHPGQSFGRDVPSDVRRPFGVRAGRGVSLEGYAGSVGHSLLKDRGFADQGGMEKARRLFGGDAPTGSDSEPSTHIAGDVSTRSSRRPIRYRAGAATGCEKCAFTARVSRWPNPHPSGRKLTVGSTSGLVTRHAEF